MTISAWHPQKYAVLYTLFLGTLTLSLEYITGPYLRFPVLFILPVVLASWYRGWPLGIGMAVLLPALRLGLEWHQDAITPWTMVEPVVNTLVRIAVLVTLAYMTARASQEQQALQEEVRTLQGILPICMWCKKIRDDQGDWQVLEAYIMHHSEAGFSHGLCPNCMQEHYGQYINPSTDTEVAGQ